MTREQTWTILLKQWKLILICFLVVGVGSFIGSRFMTPLYQSSALVQVSIQTASSQANYDDLLASDQLVQTEAQLAVSDPVLRAVAAHYRGLTPQQLADEVTTSAETSTQLFEISVRDPQPARAAALANDIAQTLIQQQDQTIQQSNQQAQQQLQQNLAATQKQINSLTKQISELQAQQNPNNNAQIAQLQSQLDGVQERYNEWQSALAQLELNQAESGNFLQIVQPAQPTSTPVQPDLLLNTSAGLLAGLLLGIFLAMVRTKLDRRVRTAEELARVWDWPALATIWKAPSSKDLLYPQEHRPNAEAYRFLRTNLGFAGIDKPFQSLLVTSTLPGEGKSTVASNLAIFMAKAGKTTLLIDADLRRPTLHQRFDLPADRLGLSNAVLAFSAPAAPAPLDFEARTSLGITARATEASSVNPSLKPYVYSVNVPNLWVMPSGPLPPNPPELLDSKAMQRFYNALIGSGFDVIIFDSPPLLGLADASILATLVDGALVVVDITQANSNNLNQIKTLLVQAGTRVLGYVVNKQRQHRGDVSTYSYYYSRGSDEMEPGKAVRKDKKVPSKVAGVSGRGR